MTRSQVPKLDQQVQGLQGVWEMFGMATNGYGMLRPQEFLAVSPCSSKTFSFREASIPPPARQKESQRGCNRVVEGGRLGSSRT